MTTPTQRLAELGLTLPPAPAPVAAYVPAVRTGNLLFVSGQIPVAAGSLTAAGTVPSRVTVETATQCARLCALNALSVAAHAAGAQSVATR